MWPQILHTEKRKSTSGLSLQLHIALFIAACCDLIYGNGQHMEWQFRLVTISLLMTLIIQHIQFLKFNPDKFKTYRFLTIIIFLLLLISIYIVLMQKYNSNTYNNIGFISIIFYHLYTIPQIYKNYQLKSTKALSNIFIYILILLSLLDLCSALLLSWNWPSIIGPIGSLITAIILFVQLIKYQKYPDLMIKSKVYSQALVHDL